MNKTDKAAETGSGNASGKNTMEDNRIAGRPLTTWQGIRKGDEEMFNEIVQADKDQIRNLIHSYPVRDVLDYMSGVMVDIAEEVLSGNDSQVMRDDAAIVAHAAKHIKS